jgi:alginate O-acetyltransferase complex protein AlgJ
VSGTVDTVSAAPRPGSVPYKDHIISAQLRDITIGGAESHAPLQAIVYFESMRDNVWTAAARLRPGDQVRVRLRPWADVSAQYEQINRSDLEDPELQLEEPTWGELIAR